MRWKLTDNNREIFMFYVYMLVAGALILGLAIFVMYTVGQKFFLGYQKYWMGYL